MGELLRNGAKMLSDSCPECNTPIFQLKNGSLLCPMCDKQVIVVSAEVDTEVIKQQKKIEETLNKKIQQIQEQLEEEMDPEKINTLLETLSKLIDTRSKLKKF
jgi:UPF0148 protein